MIDFEYKGIRVTATTESKHHDFRDSKGNSRTRFEKNNLVAVCFWDFIIKSNDLYELAFVKSTLQYFMHCYWKRSKKENSKIELMKVLYHDDQLFGNQSLIFMARQKDKNQFLQVCYQKSNTKIHEVFLDGQEVMMLEIAINKAINSLSPDSLTAVHQ